MIHPSTELRFIGPEVGYGVFATEFIPKGTITYVEDDLEVRIPESQFLSYTEPIRAVLDKYSYIDADGVRIMSWDFAKYVNHNCSFNSISTGYGFEIAIRDIHPGEELTDEYGIFNLEYPMKCYCGSPNCRREVCPSDFDDYYKEWDKLIQSAL
ncbi:MAG TPA: SET domain-containing protein-lysine N-methyltransferase, partial [Bacteroidia bacterium]|nr:SET domain-containing protein-lysine N-methyltransferase [Bacteroidia bacterium]